MAVLTNPNVLAADPGPGPRWAVISFQKVSAGDTFDLSTLVSIPAYTTITAAMFADSSSRNATTAVATIAGTTVTAVGAGMANDSCILFVLGE